MKRRKTLLALFCTLILAACSSNPKVIESDFGHEMDFSKGYNKNLWYKNDLEQLCADPSIIYCEEDGYYYMYMTSDALGCSGFNVYRSKQLNYWEQLPPAFMPDPHSWGITDLWAPNIIKIGNLYYLYYSAHNHVTSRKGISVAVASHPAGPFHEYEGFDYYGNVKTRNDQLIELGFPAIDAAPFIDTDGTLYLYFAKDQVAGVSTSCGVRMLDPVTPDLSTITELASPGKVNTTDIFKSIEWETKSSGGSWNEAPFMIKLGDKYFLTYSANYFASMTYAVGYAVGDSPLGTFTKPHSYDTENLLLGADPQDLRDQWDFMSGAGHHCFFYSGDELMIGYHAHIDRYYGASLRAFALDFVSYENDKLFVSGPTWSLQRLPKAVSGYGNMAKIATITGDSTNNINLLKDGKIPMHKFRTEQLNLQAKFEPGTHTITLNWASEFDAVAVAIYNSITYETGIFSVDKVEIEGVGTATNVPFNGSYITPGDEWYDPYLRPGCPFIVEFKEAKTNKITIQVSSNQEFALGEIVVLGR